MKDTIHYQIGQNIGDFTISSYDKNEGLYTLICKCGNTSSGASDFVTTKIANIMSNGYSACQHCTFNYQKILKEEKSLNDTLYTFKDVYREYIKKSKARDLDFHLTLEQATELFKSNCFYCDNLPSNNRRRASGNTINYQGIDRIDNSIGYLVDNVVPCCKYCNSFKMDRSYDDFIKHVKKIYFNKVQRSVPEGT